MAIEIVWEDKPVSQPKTANREIVNALTANVGRGGTVGTFSATAANQKATIAKQSKGLFFGWWWEAATAAAGEKDRTLWMRCVAPMTLEERAEYLHLLNSKDTEGAKSYRRAAIAKHAPTAVEAIERIRLAQ